MPWLSLLILAALLLSLPVGFLALVFAGGAVEWLTERGVKLVHARRERKQDDELPADLPPGCRAWWSLGKPVVACFNEPEQEPDGSTSVSFTM